MAILVLGGAGYIGSHTVYELIDAGRDVVVADNLQTGFKAAVHPKARFYKLDIRNRAALDVLFQAEKIDGVIHFAASSQVGARPARPPQSWMTPPWKSWPVPARRTSSEAACRPSSTRSIP